MFPAASFRRAHGQARIRDADRDLGAALVIPPCVAGHRCRPIDRQIEEKEALLDLEIEIGGIRIVAAVEEQRVKMAAIVGMRGGPAAS